MSEFWTKTSGSTFTSRVVDRVVAGLCLLGALLYPFTYGLALTFASMGFYVCVQSGLLHAVRVFREYEFPPTLRFATPGLAIGAMLSIHAFLRALHGDSYLEYVGGPPVTDVVHGVVVGLNHVVVPLASLVHLRQIPIVNPLWPMLLVAVEVAAVALLHELLVPAEPPRQLDDSRSKVQLLITTSVSAVAWTLLFETINRFFFAPQRSK